ncbi:MULTISPECIES: aldehyde dehydrogenase family protein [Caballeronia]|uniref:aldehyde dehydrogenase family protein n=1 Tax=Caballeronia TaxID=1827195 RepID=UPI001FD0CC46|nr:MULTISPECIES: aldehyde dehydrogenase family protein [Caballeronia]MDR5799147.1 aldehyde dehydrogenase family protein [Caballeronia sp. LZ001]
MELKVAGRAKHFIDGQWVEPFSDRRTNVVNPATEEIVGVIPQGTTQEVDRAVLAARRAFAHWSGVSKDERVSLLQRTVAALERRHEELAYAITIEMGAPYEFSKGLQAMCGVWHIGVAIELLKSYQFEQQAGTTTIVKEPIGVCAIITPWNWPINQLVCKVAPALAAGCTMIVKPAENSPLSAMIFAECVEEAGFPPGVFNLVNGSGRELGPAMSSHPEVDMVSFTGSTNAGIQVAINAAETVKRVSQELGGKSANIILDDDSFAGAVSAGVAACFNNSGQTCIAPTRMLVPMHRMDEAAEVARTVTANIRVGDPFDTDVALGPVASRKQFDSIQRYIDIGIEEGARLVAGGPGRPDGLVKGFYVRPTVFVDVAPTMRIAREEIFGPVLTIIGYESEDQAVEIANDSVYGLSGYVSSSNLDRARAIARRMRTGMVHINGAGPDFNAPFGGYKQSGNGREWGRAGLEEFLETKAIMGFNV